MKKIFAILLVAAMILGAFASCGEKGTGFEGTDKCTYAKYNADDENRYDPQGKSKVATPGKPGIYLE